MVDDRTLERLLQGEMRRLNGDLAAEGVLLVDALAMASPGVVTRAGGFRPLDRGQLERFAAPLSPLVRVSVRVPVRLHLPHELPGECYVVDGPAIEALLQHGVTRVPPRDGRLWLSLPLAQAFARRFPSLFESVRL